MVCEVVPCAIHGCSLANDSDEGRCHLAEAHAGNGQGGETAAIQAIFAHLLMTR